MKLLAKIGAARYVGIPPTTWTSHSDARVQKWANRAAGPGAPGAGLGQFACASPMMLTSATTLNAAKASATRATLTTTVHPASRW